MGAGLFATIFGLHNGPEVHVTNQTSDKAIVLIDGIAVGKVRPGKQKSFGVDRGLHLVELQNPQAETLELRNVRVRSDDAQVVLNKPSGAVELTNTSGVSLAIKIDGKKVTDIRNGDTKVLSLPAGEHTIRALYPFLNGRKSLASSRISVVNDMVTGVDFGPDDNGWLRVNNRLSSWTNVRVNGKFVQRIERGQKADIQLPLGKVDISFWRNGEKLDSASLTVKPFAENRMHLSKDGRNFMMRDGEYHFY